MKKKNLIIKNSFHKSDFNKKFIRDFENIKKEIFKSTNDTKKYGISSAIILNLILRQKI